jgi:iron(III) transport system substrate-binding protein
MGLTRRQFLQLVAFGTAGGTLYGCAPAGAPAQPAPAQPGRELSGRLVIYSSIFADGAEALKKGFEQAHPKVSVEFINPGGTEVILKRLDAERARPQADLMHSGFSTEYREAVKLGLIEPVDPKLVMGDLPESLDLGGVKVPLKDKNNYFFVWGIQFGGIEVNTERLKALKLPRPESLQDLTKPVYRGHIIFMKPQNSSTAFTNVIYTYHALGNDDAKFREFWDKLNANIAFYTEKSATLYSLVAKGEAAIGIAGSRAVYRDQQEGYPVDFIYPADGSVVLDNSMALVKGAPNRELAIEFMRWHLSREGQEAIAPILYTPVRPGIKMPRPEVTLEFALKNIPKVIVVDPDVADRKRDEILRMFDAYTQGRSR